jgi:hypothetical protein
MLFYLIETGVIVIYLFIVISVFNLECKYQKRWEFSSSIKKEFSPTRSTFISNYEFLEGKTKTIFETNLSENKVFIRKNI